MGVEFIGAKALSKRLHAIENGRVILQKLQLDTTAEAKRLVPRKTGNLGRSIAPGMLTTRDALVVARARYARYVELGTRPHVIRPRNASVLRFPAKGTPVTLSGRARTAAVRGGGAYAFAKEVHHPGTKAKPFLVPGARKAVERGGLKDVVIGLWNQAA
jgi:hypothetical protein